MSHIYRHKCCCLHVPAALLRAARCYGEAPLGIPQNKSTQGLRVNPPDQRKQNRIWTQVGSHTAGALGHVIFKGTAHLTENAHQKPLNLAQSHKKTLNRIFLVQSKFPLKSLFRWHSTSKVSDTACQGPLPERHLVSLLFRGTFCPHPDPGALLPVRSLASLPASFLLCLSGLTHPCLLLYFLFFNSLMNRILHNKVESENPSRTNQKSWIQEKLLFLMELIGTTLSAYGILGMPASYNCWTKPMFFSPGSWLPRL